MTFLSQATFFNDKGIFLNTGSTVDHYKEENESLFILNMNICKYIIYVSGKKPAGNPQSGP